MRPGAIGRPLRSVACSWTGRSSRATTASLALAGFSIRFSTSSIRSTYSRFSSGTHHMFSRHGFSSWLLSKRRTVSFPTVATMPCRATSFASSTTDQRDRPGGGGLHASATTAASLRASNFFGGLGRGSSLRAASRPRCRYRRPTRRTSRGNVPAASAASCFVHPLSSSSRIRIRRHRRIDRRFRPALIAASARRSSSFSPGNRSTDFFFDCLTHRYRSFLDPQRKSDPHVPAEGRRALFAPPPNARTP